MAQSTTGTSLVTNTAASTRKIAYRVRFDYADAGFGNESSWTDESAYVKSIEGSLQATDWRKPIAAVGKSVTDDCVVTMRNPECTGSYSGLRFSATNADGSLYSYIRDGRFLGIRAIAEIGFYDGATAEYTRQVTGYVTDVTESYKQKSVRVTIKDRSSACLQSRHTSGVYQNYSASQYAGILAAALDRDPISSSTYQRFDPGLTPLKYTWLDDDLLWQEMGLLAESQLGRVYFDKDGALVFEDGAHFVRSQSTSGDDPTESQYTFTVADFAALNPQFDKQSVYNHIMVEYQPRYLAQSQVVYALSEDQLVIPPSTSKTFTCELRYPCQDMSTLVAGTGLLATTAGGVDISSSFTPTVTEYAQKCDVVIANGNTQFTAYVTKLELVGRPLLSDQPSKYEVEDETSIARHGRRTWPVNNPYVFSHRQAQQIGDFLLQRFKEPVLRVALKGVRGVPYLEAGDRVTLVDALTGINYDWFVGRITWKWNPGDNYLMDLDLMRCSDLFTYTNYFVIGTSRYGNSTGKGRVFW